MMDLIVKVSVDFVEPCENKRWLGETLENHVIILNEHEYTLSEDGLHGDVVLLNPNYDFYNFLMTTLDMGLIQGFMYGKVKRKTQTKLDTE